MNKPAITDTRISATAKEKYRLDGHDQSISVKVLQQQAFRAGARWALDTAEHIGLMKKNTDV